MRGGVEGSERWIRERHKGVGDLRVGECELGMGFGSCDWGAHRRGSWKLALVVF